MKIAIFEDSAVYYLPYRFLLEEIFSNQNLEIDLYISEDEYTARGKEKTYELTLVDHNLAGNSLGSKVIENMKQDYESRGLRLPKMLGVGSNNPQNYIVNLGGYALGKPIAFPDFDGTDSEKKSLYLDLDQDYIVEAKEALVALFNVEVDEGKFK